MNAESLIDAGQALIGLGRHIQRTFPPPSVDGPQFDEQAVLDELLPGNEGIYVDIGAHHWCDCSNTINFYRRGWRGLLIEPNPDAWPGLLMERGEDYLSPVAASDVDGYSTLHRCRSVSSLDACWRTDNEGTMPVRTERLSTILDRYPGTEWGKTRLLSIDVEGSELAVLRGIPWDWFKPEVLMIEFANQQGEDISGPWLPILTAQGYEIRHKNQLNMILQRKIA